MAIQVNALNFSQQYGVVELQLKVESFPGLFLSFGSFPGP